MTDSGPWSQGVLRLPLFVVLVVLSGLLTSSCEDDPTAPTNQNQWKTIDLPEDLSDGVVRAVAFHGDRGIAVGTEFPSGTFVLESTDEAWESVPIGEVGGALYDVVFTVQGDAVAVGTSASFRPLVLDERESWAPTEVQAFTAILQCAGIGDDEVIRAVGLGAALRNDAPGEWTSEPANFPGAPNDKGLTDLTVGPDGSLYARGFDDGGDGSPEQPHRMIMKSEDSNWNLFAAIPSETNASQLAFDSARGFLAGGERFERNGDPHALLFLRNSSGEWIEIELPGATGWQMRDVLVASNGHVYVLGSRWANGEVAGQTVEDGILWRWDGETAKQEAAWSGRGPRAMAQSSTSLFVTGIDFRPGAIRPWMTRRTLR